MVPAAICGVIYMVLIKAVKPESGDGSAELAKVKSEYAKLKKEYDLLRTKYAQAEAKILESTNKAKASDKVAVQAVGDFDASKSQIAALKKEIEELKKKKAGTGPMTIPTAS